MKYSYYSVSVCARMCACACVRVCVCVCVRDGVIKNSLFLLMPKISSFTLLFFRPLSHSNTRCHNDNKSSLLILLSASEEILACPS